MDQTTQQTISEVTNFVKTASPYVWKVTYRDTIIGGIEGLVAAIVFLAASFRLFKESKKYSFLLDEGIDIDKKTLCLIGSVLVGLIGWMILGNYLPELLNPGFKTIDVIVKLANKN